MYIDLSPFQLKDLPTAVGMLHVKEPFALVPHLTEDGQLICLTYEPWDLHVYAPTRNELATELLEHMAMLWQEYATEQDDQLDAMALELKQRLLNDLQFENYE